MMFLLLGVGLPLSADVQTSCSRYRRQRRSHAARTYRPAPAYYTRGYAVRRPSFYRRHRNVINMAIGTGGGALLGALLGGKKGALIGTAIGAGSSALYTYKLNPKKRRYYRYR